MGKYIDVVEELSYGKFHYVIQGCDLPVALPLVVSYVYKRRMSEKGKRRAAVGPRPGNYRPFDRVLRNCTVFRRSIPCAIQCDSKIWESSKAHIQGHIHFRPRFIAYQSSRKRSYPFSSMTSSYNILFRPWAYPFSSTTSSRYNILVGPRFVTCE